jgi:hypothetical protein
MDEREEENVSGREATEWWLPRWFGDKTDRLRSFGVLSTPQDDSAFIFGAR